MKLLEQNYDAIAKVLEQINRLYENGADKEAVDSLLKDLSFKSSILLDEEDIESIDKNYLKRFSHTVSFSTSKDGKE